MRKLLMKPHAVFLGMLFTLCIAIFYAIGLKVPVILDETVTIANGEYLIGNDWSFQVATNGSLYFKYLYGIFMIPFMVIFSNPQITYRAMMITNAVLQASTMPVCYLICRRFLNVSSVWHAVFIGMCATCVPSVFLYTYYARGDIFLIVMPWYVLLFLLEAIRASECHVTRRVNLCTVGIVLCSMIAFMAHSRGIVVIFAAVLSSLFIGVFKKRKTVNWIVFICTSFAMLLLDYALSQYFKTNLYWINGTLFNTLNDTPLNSYLNIFSLKTAISLFAMASAWFFTLFSSTLGLITIGLIMSIYVVFSVFRKENSLSDNEILVVFFFVLIFLFYIAVGMLYFKNTYHNLRCGILNNRVDRLLYDRYSACGLGGIVFFAVYALSEKSRMVTKWHWVCMISVNIFTLALFFWKCYPITLRYDGYIYNTIALCTFSEIEDAWSIMSGTYYTSKMIIGSAILGGAGFFLWFFFHQINLRFNGKTIVVMMVLILIAQLLLINVNYYKIRLASNDIVLNRTSYVVSYIHKLQNTTKEYPYVLKNGTDGVKIQYYQQQLPESKVLGNALLPLIKEDYLIISTPQAMRITAESVDIPVYCLSDIDYNVTHDTIYVSGDHLRHMLEETGYTLYPFHIQNS